MTSDASPGPSGMRLSRWAQVVAWFGLAFVLLLASGVQTLLPVLFLVLCSVALLLVVLTPDWRAGPFGFLPRHRAAGVLLLAALYGVEVVFGRMEPLDFVLASYALAGFALAHVVAVLGLRVAGGTGERRLRYTALGVLVVILSGQLAQVAGLLILPNAGDGEDVLRHLLRPGGFHNPNMASAIALGIFELLLVVSRTSGLWTRWPGGVLLAAIVILAQSRAVAIFVVVRLLSLLWDGLRTGGGPVRRVALPVLVASVMLLPAGMAALQGEIGPMNPLDLLVARFSGDESSSERATLLRLGMEAFGEAPWFGHGYRYMTGRYGLSSHNEIVENLVNWGVAGSLPVWLGFALAYGQRRPFIWLSAIAPSLIFGHNFFANLSLQVAIGTLLGVCHATSSRETHSDFRRS